MEQIHQRGYYKKYLNNGKDIFLLGIEFNHENKNISNFNFELQKCFNIHTIQRLRLYYSLINFSDTVDFK